MTLAHKMIRFLAAATLGTAITVTLPALGAGNTNATASVQGYNR